MALKSKVGEFHHQFSGSEQNDSHEFLTYLFAWLHEDLRGGSLPACLPACLPWWWSYISSCGSIRAKQRTLITTILFQGMHQYVILQCAKKWSKLVAGANVTMYVGATF